MGGITRLLLLLWAGVTVSTAVDLQKRIIGGQPCGQNERPYHVRLRVTDGTRTARCGGSLINSQWILTAAHCQKPGRTIYATLEQEGETEVEIKSKPVVYKDSSNRIHDIMLLKLPNPTRVQPIPLPRCNNQPRVGEAVQIAGFGAVNAGPDNERVHGRPASTLQCAETTVVNCQRLTDLMSYEYRDALYQHWFCGQRAGVDTCPGDSGGGVVYNGMIYGVHAFTGDSDYACKEAAGFMDVCKYMEWIRNTTKKP